MTTALTNPPTTLAASLIDWLLGLTRVSYADARAELGWRFDLPGWLWVAIVLGAAAFAVWSYSRLIGRKRGRFTLATMRALLILFLAVLLAGPMLVVRDEIVEEDWLLVLMDRSASMNIRDSQPAPGSAPGSAPGGAPGSDADDTVSTNQRITRNRSLRDALWNYTDLFGEEKLGRDRRILWLGFHAGTFEIDDPVTDSVMLPPAEGQSTAIRTAIEQALQRAAGRPISGVVLFTDGRTHEPTGAELMRALKGVSVFPVPLGSPRTPLNLAVGRVEAPEKAFVNDVVPVNVYIDRYPQDAAVDPANVTVRLTDPVTGKTLDEQTPGADGLDGPVRLTTRSAVAGPATWEVELVYNKPAGDPAAPDELLTEDNTEPVAIELVDRPLRVLYVEGYPRWEYRYLKQLLIREKSIQSSMMLISADRSFAQEGDLPITRLPDTIEELEPYDVVIIGDVPSDYFSTDQLAMIRDHVAARGAGLLWIGGPYSTPRSYEATPLADLLPMREPGVVEPIDPDAIVPIAVRPTPLAEQLNVLRLRSTETIEGDESLWPENLAPLQWVQDLGPLKQLAEPLAVARPDGDGQTLPMVVRLRYGAGQSLYVATEDIWRWRFGRGNYYVEQFWVQLVQMLGKARIQQSDERAWLDVSHRRVDLDEAVVVSLHLEDPLLLQRDLPRISVGVFRSDEEGDLGARPIERLELLPTDAPGSGGAFDAPGAGVDGAASAGRRYETIWRPNAAGRLTLRVIEPALDDLNIARGIEVVRPDDELRDPATDHPRLAQLAEQTGGEVVPLDDLDRLLSLVRYHTRRTANDNPEPLWDSPLALLIVLLLLTMEWIGRKLMRLV